jgi:hypothetical protein
MPTCGARAVSTLQTVHTAHGTYMLGKATGSTEGMSPCNLAAVSDAGVSASLVQALQERGVSELTAVQVFSACRSRLRSVPRTLIAITCDCVQVRVIGCRGHL